MAFKGYGVGHIDGKVIFVPHTVTGDEALVEIVEEKRDYSMGRLEKIIIPSPWRIDPPCPYFGACGGCHWQYIDDPAQGELKKEILRETLRRLGGFNEIPSISVASSLDPYGYRSRAQLKVNGKFLGFYQERSHRIVDIEHCLIAHPLINKMIRILRKERSSLAWAEEIEVNISPEEEKGVLIFHSQLNHRRMENLIKTFLRIDPIFKGLALKTKGRWTYRGEPHLNFTLSLNACGRKDHLWLQISPESFFQVNLKQNQKLVDTVIEFSGAREDEKVLDLYAGAGNLTLPLAINVREVWGIEENHVAVQDAKFNAERNGIQNSHFIQGKVEEALKNWTGGKPDLVILDPPRTGCKKVIDLIVKLEPKKIVYVSCEPTTLSRDLRLFSERGYHLQKLCLIDMFPQTYHMEVVALLTQPQVKV